MNPGILHRHTTNKNGRQMPGSIHLPGWVGLLLERLRTGLRVESLTPWQSSVSAGIHCCTNPYHAKRNGVNSIWRPETVRPRFSWSGRPPNKNRPRVYSKTAPQHRFIYSIRGALSQAGDPMSRAPAAQAPAAHRVSATPSTLAPVRRAAVPFRDCTRWQKSPVRPFFRR
jgi:hypothetical protein